MENEMLYNVSIFAEQVIKKSFWNRKSKTIIHKLTEQVIKASSQHEADLKKDKIVKGYVDMDPDFFSKLVLKSFAIKIK